MPAAAFLEAYRQPLRQEMAACLPPLPVLDLARYHLGWVDEEGGAQPGGGKLLRPLLCLAACKALGGEPAQALPAAAAVELVHNFSLIHDDIQDVSPLRRHRPTVWKRWGQAQAINAGDALFAAARLALLRLRGRGVAPSRVVQAATILDEACLRLCHGQYLDLSYETAASVTLRDYTRMVLGKTAALFEASLLLGGVVAGARAAALRPLRRCGRYLGLAFQIQDDALGLWGEEQATGKTATDILRKKKGFPVVYALSQGRSVGHRLASLFEKEVLAEEDVSWLREILESAGAIDHCRLVAAKYYCRALNALNAPALNGASPGELKEILDRVKERER